jgi:hypothetical protein
MGQPMDISGATELYILHRSRVPLVLIPDSTGIPTVLHPSPVLHRAAYVSDNVQETGVPAAKQELGTDKCSLLAPISCPDGPPYRAALLFTFQQPVTGMPWRDGSQSFPAASMLQFAPVTTQAPWQWISDARQGRPGYFLTGTVGTDSLWRLFRLETDAFHRAIFTLVPVQLSSGCPHADFSSVSTPLLAVELAAQYVDLGRSVAGHSYRDVVTKARSIVEGLISERLKVSGYSVGRDLFDDLQTIKRLLEDSQQRDTCGWTQLEYHLAHKIRLVHGQTHATQTAKSGRVLRPEFALSVVEDLVELLSIWGYCKA